MGALSKIHNEEEEEDDDDKDDQKVNELIIPNSCISKRKKLHELPLLNFARREKQKGVRAKYLNSTWGGGRANASQKRLTDSKAKARDHVYLGVGGGGEQERES